MRHAFVATAALIGGCARIEAAGTADDLRAIAKERGVDLQPGSCAAVDHTRIVVCSAEVDRAALPVLRDKLVLQPLAGARAPGPPSGRSRCLDEAPAGASAWVTSFPWIPKSHYRYLLLVIAPDGHACVETAHGYG